MCWCWPLSLSLPSLRVPNAPNARLPDSLRNAIDLALEQPTEAVELDFAQVSYIDSTGIGVLVGAAHHAVDHGKRFSCTNVQPPVMRVVQLLGVDQEISITAA